jgi:hypothetical protein
MKAPIGKVELEQKPASELGLEARIRERLELHEAKAWDALARYKFERFGYHAAAWVQHAQLLEPAPPNPFRSAVKLARIDSWPTRAGRPADRIDRIDELLEVLSPLWTATVCRCGSRSE